MVLLLGVHRERREQGHWGLVSSGRKHRIRAQIHGSGLLLGHGLLHRRLRTQPGRVSKLPAIEADEGPPGPSSSVRPHGCPLVLLGLLLLLLLLRRPLRQRRRLQGSLLLLWMWLGHPELAWLLLGQSLLVLWAKWCWLPVTLDLLSWLLSRGPLLGRVVS